MSEKNCVIGEVNHAFGFRLSEFGNWHSAFGNEEFRSATKTVAGRKLKAERRKPNALLTSSDDPID